MVETELFILQANKKWMLLQQHPNSHYYPSQQVVLQILNSIHGKGSNIPSQKGKIFQTNHVKVEIIEVESHRHCSILICIQESFLTGEFRYLVYGINRPGYEDYGIGTSLSSFATIADTYFPEHYHGKCGKYIDA